MSISEWVVFQALLGVGDLSFGYYLFFFQAEDGIRDLVRSRGLGDVYKRQDSGRGAVAGLALGNGPLLGGHDIGRCRQIAIAQVLSLIHI